MAKKNSQDLVNEYKKLLKQQEDLKAEIKKTHIEVEWLEREKKVFAKSPIWQLGYFLKHLKSKK